MQLYLISLSNYVSENIKDPQESMGNTYCLLDDELHKTPGRNGANFLPNLKLGLPYHPGIYLLSLEPREVLAHVNLGISLKGYWRCVLGPFGRKNSRMDAKAVEL